MRKTCGGILVLVFVTAFIFANSASTDPPTGKVYTDCEQVYDASLTLDLMKECCTVHDYDTQSCYVECRILMRDNGGDVDY